jgi:dimethylamine/trimethylamine dehydrogenase
LFESGLKGLAAWKRVVDNRVHEILQKNNIEIYKESKLTSAHINELEIKNIFIATGSKWRKDGVGRSRRSPIKGIESVKVFTPEEIIQEEQNIKDPVIIYDDEQGYLAGVLADHLSSKGIDVTFVTPASVVSPWTESTLEQKRVQKSLISAGVKIVCNSLIEKIENQTAHLECVFTGAITELSCKSVVMVTERIANTSLYDQLTEQKVSNKPHSIAQNIRLIGDAEAPGLIADAVFSGHLAAQDFEATETDIEKALFMREMPSLND